MELNCFIPLHALFGCVRRREDRSGDYGAYWKDGADDPELDDEVLVAAPVQVERDRDVFPGVVVDHDFWIFCSDEVLQDVVDVALDQNPSVTDERLRDALLTT